MPEQLYYLSRSAIFNLDLLFLHCSPTLATTLLRTFKTHNTSQDRQILVCTLRQRWRAAEGDEWLLLCLRAYSAHQVTISDRQQVGGALPRMELLSVGLQ